MVEVGEAEAVTTSETSSRAESFLFVAEETPEILSVGRTRELSRVAHLSW